MVQIWNISEARCFPAIQEQDVRKITFALKNFFLEVVEQMASSGIMEMC